MQHSGKKKVERIGSEYMGHIPQYFVNTFGVILTCYLMYCIIKTRRQKSEDDDTTKGVFIHGHVRLV